MKTLQRYKTFLKETKKVKTSFRRKSKERKKKTQ